VECSSGKEVSISGDDHRSLGLRRLPSSSSDASGRY
jgi:hypothetical protein